MKYNHDPNKILESCAEILKTKIGFNPKQVLRYFMLFPLAGYEEFLDVPSEEYENWYELKIIDPLTFENNFINTILNILEVTREKCHLQAKSLPPRKVFLKGDLKSGKTRFLMQDR